MKTNPSDCILSLRQTLIYSVSIADNKAGILMGSNFLVVSILVSQIVNKGLLLALCLPLVFSLLLLFLSMRALSPKFIDSGNMPNNLLFFRHIASFPYEEYRSQMMSNFHSDEDLYKMMLLDCYQVSNVLDQKHRNLQVCFKATYLFIGIYMAFILITYIYSVL